VETPPSAPRPWEALVPLSILALHLALGSRQPLYLDWIPVLCVYWILYVFLSRSRAMAAVTATTMVALLAIYLSRAFPQILDTLNLCR
jgi:hypothetical protein